MKQIVTDLINFLPELLDKASNRQSVLNTLLLITGTSAVLASGWIAYKYADTHIFDEKEAKTLLDRTLDGECSLWKVPYEKGQTRYAIEKTVRYDAEFGAVQKTKLLLNAPPKDIEIICDKLKKGFVALPKPD